ncbi:hypothetical protein [Massilia phosphatilytica]
MLWVRIGQKRYAFSYNHAERCYRASRWWLAGRDALHLFQCHAPKRMSKNLRDPLMD